MSYSSYDHDDLEPASTMRIERRIYFESGKADLSEAVKLPLAELLSLRAESAAAEQEAAVPEFFAQPEKQLTPDECMTGEQIQTPRGRFYLTDRSREQMEAAGYGFHHQSEDGRYLIMANGTRAFAIPAQQESHIKTAEMSTEQNYNMIDGMMNNAPSMEELEARAKAGEQISLLDVAEAAKAEAKKPKQTRRTTQKQKKPSIRAQLAAAKEEQKKKPPTREKSKEMEV